MALAPAMGHHHALRSQPPFCLFVAALACSACSGDDGDDRPGLPPVTAVKATPQAQCVANVIGIGEIDLENDYLPHVVHCENGGANFEALKAQAIAARSVVYQSMATHGNICDGQGCQVYSCGSEPTEEQRRAVAETAGQILTYNGQITYGFFVAGDPNTAPPDCVGKPGAKTESLVTYNEGAVGDDVEQTELGWVYQPGEGGYGTNRGCMSQWGARCLENNFGYRAEDILRTYYGADIEILHAQGECVGPAPEPQPTPPEPPAPACDAVLAPGEVLFADEWVSSCNGRFTLWMQSDGNVVLYEEATGKALWNTQTVGTKQPALVMQEDGNFVLYDGNGAAVWHTSTHGHPGAMMRVEDAGNVVVWNGWTPIWSAR
ncbi:MAG: hypothetical protein IPK74_23775 [Deltaproteobacteria bacterium]|nr:hypothetical protein [Deltaproteobacteria bacterium]